MTEQNKPTNVCEWLGEDDYDVWHTSCNRAWEFIEGGPKENHINFCPFCGKQVVITIYESEEDDDV